MAKTRYIRYRPDRKSFGAFMVSEQMRDVTAEVSSDIGGRASQLTPRGKEHEEGDEPALHQQFQINREAGTYAIGGNVRVMVEVFNPARKAAAVEFGSKRNKRTRMLGRAGAEYGDFKPDGGPEL